MREDRRGRVYRYVNIYLDYLNILFVSYVWINDLIISFEDC